MAYNVRKANHLLKPILAQQSSIKTNGTVNLSFAAPRSNHKFSFWLPGVSFKESSDNWKITGKSR